MCGIVGSFGPKNIQLTSSLDRLRHRGPDSGNVFSGPDWQIAFARLSIFDLSPRGMQPFKNKQCTIFYNGEIYNFKDLANTHKCEYLPKTRSDGEILPFLFTKYGIKFLNKVNGMFAMAIIDNLSGEKYLIRDRFAKKPLYFAKSDQNIIFASEIKAIKAIIPCKPCPDLALINLFFWGLPPPFSNFKNIFSILPGNFVRILPDNTFQTYQWYNGLNNLKEHEFKEDTFFDIFKDAVKLRYEADVPVGILLSGGLDSMLITDTLRREGKTLTALTCDIPFKSKIESPTDTTNPTQYCKQYSLSQISTKVDYDYWNKNILSIVESFDEIFLDSGNLIFYALGELAKKNNIKVVLVGNGGDELFGGYPWQSRVLNIPFFLQKTSSTKNLLLSKVEEISSHFSPGIFLRRFLKTARLLLCPSYGQMDIGGVFSYDILYNNRQPAKKIHNFANEINPCKANSSKMDWGNCVNQINIRQLVPQQNFKVDMGTMAFSVENRCPFLDYRVVEYMMAVSHSSKVLHGQKSLLRAFAKSKLPDYIVRSKKSGPTMPIGYWFKGKELSIAKQFLKSCKPLFGDFFGGPFADYWNNSKIEWENSKNSLTLFSLISLGLWLHYNIQSVNLSQSPSFEEFVLGQHQ